MSQLLTSQSSILKCTHDQYTNNCFSSLLLQLVYLKRLNFTTCISFKNSVYIYRYCSCLHFFPALPLSLLILNNTKPHKPLLILNNAKLTHTFFSNTPQNKAAFHVTFGFRGTEDSQGRRLEGGAKLTAAWHTTSVTTMALENTARLLEEHHWKWMTMYELGKLVECLNASCIELYYIILIYIEY